MQRKMRCLIIDDEPLARKGIEKMVQEIPFLELKNSFSNATLAMEDLNKDSTDLVFLDIEMPKLSGIDLLKTIPGLPPVIITTAFPDYAVLGYELNIIDYLLKPISFQRFLKAVNKAHDIYRKGHTAVKEGSDYIFVKSSGTFEKIFLDDILFVKALQNYVLIQLTERKIIAYLTMKNIEDSLPVSSFMKISKSCIVSKEKVQSINGNQLMIKEHSLIISRSHKDELIEELVNKRLLIRK
jgi:DNA-binding LytR/AlgR family response regulator